MTELTPYTHQPQWHSYSDYDIEDGPVYVITDPENSDAWIQSTYVVTVDP